MPPAGPPAFTASTLRGSSSTPCRRCSHPRVRAAGVSAVVGDGGGYGAVASDLLGAARPRPARARRETQASLRASLPPTAATANPVDLAGAGEQDPFSFARTTRALLEAPEVDAVLFTAYFGGYSSLSDELRERELAVARELVAATDADADAARRAHDVLGLSRRPRRSARPASPSTARSSRRSPAWQCSPPTPSPRAARSAARPAAARARVVDAGYPAARASPRGSRRPVRRRPTSSTTASDAVAAAEELGFPVVAEGARLAAQVRCGRRRRRDRGHAELETAIADLTARLDPPAFSVETDEGHGAGFELLVGARRDARFGPIVLVGAGGTSRGDPSRHRGRARADRRSRRRRSSPLARGRPAAHGSAWPRAARPRRGGRVGRRALALRGGASGDRRGRGQSSARPRRPAPSGSTRGSCRSSA